MSDISFDQLYKEYKDKLLVTISKRVKDKDEAEDLVQECMLKIYENIDKYDNKYALSTWVYTIAFNTVNNYYRSNGRSPQLTSVAELYDNSNTLSHDSPENILISEQTKSKVDKAIHTMSEDLLKAFTMKEDDGLSFKKISELLGIPINTAKSRVRRARELLTKALV